MPPETAIFPWFSPPKYATWNSHISMLLLHGSMPPETAVF
jgi:hypothetical protein